MTDHARPLRRLLVLAAGMSLVAGVLTSSVAKGQAQAAAPALPLAAPAALPTVSRPNVGTKVASVVKLNQSQLRLVKGKSFTLEESITYGRWNGESTSSPTQTYYAGRGVWTSSNPKVATVNFEGKVTAKKPGTATITVTAKDYTGGWQKTSDNFLAQRSSASVKVTVVKSKPKAKVTKVTASVPKELTMTDRYEITGKYSSSKATGVKVKYSSSRPDIVMVDRAGVLYAWAKGTAKIKVTAGGKSKTYKVKVVDWPASAVPHVCKAAS